MGLIADGYRLRMYEVRVTRIRCELKAEEMGGKECIMWGFVMCSAC